MCGGIASGLERLEEPLPPVTRLPDGSHRKTLALTRCRAFLSATPRNLKHLESRRQCAYIFAMTPGGLTSRTRAARSSIHRHARPERCRTDRAGGRPIPAPILTGVAAPRYSRPEAGRFRNIPLRVHPTHPEIRGRYPPAQHGGIVSLWLPVSSGILYRYGSASARHSPADIESWQA